MSVLAYHAKNLSHHSCRVPNNASISGRRMEEQSKRCKKDGTMMYTYRVQKSETTNEYASISHFSK